MESMGLKYHPRYISIGRSELREDLLSVREFVRSRSDLWFTDPVDTGTGCFSSTGTRV